MTISRAKPAGWGIGDKLTSAEQNQVDTNTTYALDKRVGQTDSLQSVVHLTGAGRFYQAANTAPNANSTIQIDTQTLVFRITSNLTASRDYTLSNTNANNGDRIIFYCDTAAMPGYDVNIKNNGGTTIATLGPTAEFLHAEFQFVGGAWISMRGVGSIRRMRQVFTSSGNWTKPANFIGTHVEIEGHGGGGGGGGPASVASGTNVYGSGGAGGGGAQYMRAFVDVSSIASLGTVPVTIGAGGLGGAAPGTDGVDGDSTTFDVAPPTVEFFGGMGGGRGRSTTDANRLVMAIGGTPTPNCMPRSTAAGVIRSWEPITGATNVVPPMQPGQGGHAGSPNTNYTFNGALPTNQMIPGNGGIAAGIAGTAGTDDGSYRGGGAGGGGGAGPSGAGANGGNGGSGNAAGVGTASTSGANAAANTGGGGGGAGGTGHGSAGLGVLSAGGNGGSGQLIVWWWEKRPVP